MIFVDSDAYLALAGIHDPHHNKAWMLHQQISKEELITSWDVVDEVATKLSRFTDKVTADLFLKKLPASNTRIEFATPVLAPIIMKLFIQQRSKKVSMTDCTNMVIARQLGVKTFFSFDHHYVQNGFSLLS